MFARFNKIRKKHSSFKTLAHEELRQVKALTDSDINLRIKRINDDFERGFKLLKQHRNTVTFFGSARSDESNPYYQQARLLARKIVTELKSSVVTGGGRGIMQAANQGAREASGNSLGMSIELPYEQVTNKYVNYSVAFYYFFSRKVALSFAARAYVYFPGGFGTLDELFEILTLKQTGKINPVPIILIGTEYWQPLVNFIETELVKRRTINKEDTQLYILTDDLDRAIQIIAGSHIIATKSPLTKN